MMTSRLWPLDDHGLAQIPRRFYWLLLLLLRPYLCWVLVLTVPAQQQDLLGLFYPQKQDFMLACLIALPLLPLLAALSQRKPKGNKRWFYVWKQGRGLLLFTAFIDVVVTVMSLPKDVILDAPWKIVPVLLLCLAIIWLLLSKLLKTVFQEWPD